MSRNGRKRSRPRGDVDALGEACEVEWTKDTEAMIGLTRIPICLVGRGKFKLVHGEVTVHGFSLNADEQWYPFESPAWTSWLTLMAVTAEAKVHVSSTRQQKDSSTKPSFEIKSAVEGGSRPTVVPTNWKEAWDTFVDHFRDRVAYTDQQNNLKQHALFRETLEHSTETTDSGNDGDGGLVMAVVGAKNMGKSTCVRYGVNRLLSTSDRVCILDADLGQPEFSPPGMVSLTMLEKPILSQPHLHLVTNTRKLEAAAPRHEAARWFGATSSQVDPEGYVQCIKDLVEHYRELRREEPNIALVVNLDGWVKGLGLQILDAVLAVLRPSDIIQLLRDSESKALDLNVPAEVQLCTCYAYNASVKIATSLENNGKRNDEEVPEVSHSPSNSIVDATMLSATPSSIPAPTLRTLRIISYFLDDISLWDNSGPGKHELLLDNDCIISELFASQKPYAVPLSCLETSFTREEARRDIRSTEAVLDALNGSIVGLCHRGESQSYYPPCVGLGLIRSIDHERKTLFVLTPVDAEFLPSVGMLLMGDIPLPLECYFRGRYSDNFPYTSFEGDSEGIPGVDPMASRNSIVRRSAGN